jgi:hypothetical protein
MEKVYIDGELAYPIYQIEFTWLDKNDKKDSTGWKVMFKEPLTDDEQQEKLKEYGEQLERKYNSKCMQGSMKFVEYETWCIERFCHYTYDNGQTNQEVLDSFEKFVQRKENMNLQNGHQISDPDYSLPNWTKTYYCLMGAEDRWRWCGGEDREHRTDAPCRCEGCKKNGLIRINH